MGKRNRWKIGIPNSLSFSPNAHFLLSVTNFFKNFHLYFLSSNFTFVPLFSSLFSLFSVSLFLSRISLSTAPLALFCHTQLLQWPFPNGPRSTPNPSLSPCSSRLYYTAVPNPDPNYLFCSIPSLVQGQFRINSPSRLHQMLTDVAKEARLIYLSAEWECLRLDQGCKKFPVMFEKEQ